MFTKFCKCGSPFPKDPKHYIIMTEHALIILCDKADQYKPISKD